MTLSGEPTSDPLPVHPQRNAREPAAGSGAGTISSVSSRSRGGGAAPWPGGAAEGAGVRGGGLRGRVLDPGDERQRWRMHEEREAADASEASAEPEEDGPAPAPASGGTLGRAARVASPSNGADSPSRLPGMAGHIFSPANQARLRLHAAAAAAAALETAEAPTSESIAVATASASSNALQPDSARGRNLTMRESVQSTVNDTDETNESIQMRSAPHVLLPASSTELVRLSDSEDDPSSHLHLQNSLGRGTVYL